MSRARQRSWNMFILAGEIVLPVCVLFLVSCAMPSRYSTVVPATDLPAEVAMNEGAGKGMFLLVKLRLEDGEDFPCMVDTGAPVTRLPRSVEPKLGRRLGTRKFSTLDAIGPFTEYTYAAPKLYLGDVQLTTGSHIGTSDDTPVLGMDCLRHYCIQLDFQARTIRFLDPEKVNPAELGKAFALVDSNYAMIEHPGLFEEKSSEVLIDTGCALDGYVEPRLFKRVVRSQQARSLSRLGPDEPNVEVPEIVLVSECVWDGRIYSDVIIGKGPNLIGLKFLGHHLVTFNFPNGMMYLKQVGDNSAKK